MSNLSRAGKVSVKIRIKTPTVWYFIFFLMVSCSANASIPSGDWKTLKTEHFLIHFDERHEAYAQRLAAIAENVHHKTTEWLRWWPHNRTEVVIDDSVDFSNGGASPLPYNRSIIYMQPPSGGELISNEPWLEQVFTHEYIHVLHLDQASGFPGGLRKIFGRILFSFPQIFSPKFVSEGLAVYGETDHDKGFGRGQSAIYQAMMRTEVSNGLRSLTELSYHGYQGTDWPRGQVYLYGYYFFEFIEQTYGQEKIIEYIRNWNNNIVPWRMNARAKQVFGVSGKVLWEKFQQYLHHKFDPQLELLTRLQGPVTPVTENDDINVGNPVWLDNGTFYYYESDGRSPARIIKRSGDKQKEIGGVKGLLMFDVNQQGDILMSRFEICDGDKLYADLYLRSEGSWRWRRLTRCGRYTKAFWSKDGQQIVAVRAGDGAASLVSLGWSDKARKRLIETELLSELKVGDALGALAWSPDSRYLIASVKRQATGWNLERFDMSTKAWRWLTKDAHIQQAPQISRDGSTLYYIADSLLDEATQTQQMTVFAMDLDTLRPQALMTTISAITAFAIDPADKQIRFVEYTPEGRQILQQAIKLPEVLVDADVSGNIIEASESSSASPEIEAFVNSADYDPDQYQTVGDYYPLLSMRPRAWWIWLTSDSVDNTSAQLIIDGLDARGRHYWQAAPEIFFEKETAGGSLAYIYRDRFAFIGSRDIDTVQDEDEDDNEPSIWDVEERVQAILSQPFSSLANRFRINLGIGAEWIERIVENFNGSKSRSDRQDNLVGLSLSWDSSERFVHSISQESGRFVKLTAEHYGLFADEDSHGLQAHLDWREFISLWGSHVLVLRYVEGVADNDTRGLQLGGYSDDLATVAGAIGFGKNEFALRGYDDDIDELIGQRLRLGSLEWRIPLFDFFDGLSAPPIGLGKGSMAVFVDTGAVWDKNDEPDYLTGAGLEFNPQILIGFDTFALDLTFGAAYGFDDELGGTELYLRLGARL